MIYRFYNSEIDTDLFQLRVDGVPVPLEPQAYAVLLYLVEHRNEVVTRDTLMDTIWAGRVVTDSSLTSRIKVVRAALGKTASGQPMVKTIHRVGYRFVAEVTELLNTRASPDATLAHPHPSESAITPVSTISQNVTASLTKPSLAVLPFRCLNTDGDSTAQHLADGLSTEIMTALVKHSGLVLASDFSTLTCRHQTPELTAVASELGVSHILEGTVSASNQKVRVHTCLTDTTSGTHRWAERFDKTLDDLFAVQDEITEAVVTALDVQLVMGKSARIYRQALTNPEALHRYYKGWSHLIAGTRHELEQAQMFFEQAIELDPESPLPQAMAAWAYWWGALQGMTDDPQRSFERSEALAIQAQQKGDPSGFSALVMAHTKLTRGNHAAALEIAQHALAYRPNCDASYAAITNILNYLNRADEAVPYAQQAIRLTPLVPTIYPAILAKSYYSTGRFSEAACSAESIVAQNNDSVDAWIMLAAANSAMCEQRKAQTAVAQIRRIKPALTLDEYCASQPYVDNKPLEQLKTHLALASFN